MNITELRSKARNLAALIQAGTGTADQVTELRSITDQILAHEDAAAVAVRAITAAGVEAVADVDVVRAAASAGELFTRGISNYDGRGKSQVIDTPSNARAFVGTGDLNINPTRVDVAEAVKPLPLTGLVSHQPVSTNAVEWVIETLSDSAGVVAEGEEKPEATFTSVVEAGVLDTIAVTIPVSRQAVEDEARLTAIFDGKMRASIAQKIERSIATAITGGSYVTATEDTLLAAIRQAIAGAHDEFAPTAVLLNPFDHADLDISLVSANLGPVRGVNVWELKIVTSTQVPRGAAFVGDFNTGVTLFDRGTLASYMTDSHLGNFTKNILNLLSEARTKAIVTNSAAIIKAAVTPVAP